MKTMELTESERRLIECCEKGDRDEEAIALLQQRMVRVECADENGLTALMTAAFRGRPRLVDALIGAGADVNSNAHRHFYSPLHFAALNGCAECCQLLLDAGASTSSVNSIGKAPAELAAFTGHRVSASLITNYCDRAMIDAFTRPTPIERVAKLKVELAPLVHRIVGMRSVNPVRFLNFLDRHPSLIAERSSVRQVLESIMEKQLASGEEFGEKLALKLHVYQELIGFIDYYGDDGGQGRSMLEMKKMFIKGRDPDGYPELQERFLRETLRTFPFPRSLLMQVCVKALSVVEIGASPSALCAMSQGIFGLFAAANDECTVCGERFQETKHCAVCKRVDYCSHECQKLHWFTHRRHCAWLAAKRVEDENKALQEHEAEKEKEALAAADRVVESDLPSDEKDEVPESGNCEPSDTGTSSRSDLTGAEKDEVPESGNCNPDADEPSETGTSTRLDLTGAEKDKVPESGNCNPDVDEPTETGTIDLGVDECGVPEADPIIAETPNTGESKHSCLSIDAEQNSAALPVSVESAVNSPDPGTTSDDGSSVKILDSDEESKELSNSDSPNVDWDDDSDSDSTQPREAWEAPDDDPAGGECASGFVLIEPATKTSTKLVAGGDAASDQADS